MLIQALLPKVRFIPTEVLESNEQDRGLKTSAFYRMKAKLKLSMMDPFENNLIYGNKMPDKDRSQCYEDIIERCEDTIHGHDYTMSCRNRKKHRFGFTKEVDYSDIEGTTFRNRPSCYDEFPNEFQSFFSTQDEDEKSSERKSFFDNDHKPPSKVTPFNLDEQSDSFAALEITISNKENVNEDSCIRYNWISK